jgi:hypothetical protein
MNTQTSFYYYLKSFSTHEKTELPLMDFFDLQPPPRYLFVSPRRHRRPGHHVAWIVDAMRGVEFPARRRLGRPI